MPGAGIEARDFSSLKYETSGGIFVALQRNKNDEVCRGSPVRKALSFLWSYRKRIHRSGILTAKDLIKAPPHT